MANAPKTQYLNLGFRDSDDPVFALGFPESELGAIEDMSLKITLVWNSLPHFRLGNHPAAAVVSWGARREAAGIKM